MPINSDIRKSTNPLYGIWKFIEEIDLEDMITNPVWVWCVEVDEDLAPPDGDETCIRPVLGDSEVPLDHIAPPIILLRVKGTNYYALGLYEHDKEELESIGVFVDGNVLSPEDLDNLPKSVVYCSVPSIDGEIGIEFIPLITEPDRATVRGEKQHGRLG